MQKKGEGYDLKDNPNSAGKFIFLQFPLNFLVIT